MKRLLPVLTFLAGCVLGAVVMWGFLPIKEEPPSRKPPQPPPAVYRVDLLEKGSFGSPLGKYLTVGGTIAHPGRWPELLVDTVDGRKLAAPVLIPLGGADFRSGRIRSYFEALPEGQRCVLRGFESGQMAGRPKAVEQAEGWPRGASGWYFRKHFEVTSVVEPKAAAEALKKIRAAQEKDK
jgi:hypothetical protein